MTDVLDKAGEQTQFLLEAHLRHITQSQSPNDTFECVDCGQPIGEKRKQALPHAVRCVGCQWQWERTHERGGR